MQKIREFVTGKGIRIIAESLSSGMRGSTFQKNGIWYILINRDDPEERQNFTIAHEYSEIQLYDDPSLDNNEKHHLANRMASELLLPEETFGTLVHELDLHQLKEEFPEVSYEVIARRYPHFLSCVVTIYDNFEQTARFGSDTIRFPHTPSPVESGAVKQCYDTQDTVVIEEPPLKVRCYLLTETNNIKRVICIAEVDRFD